ncbi:hypothetical protein MA16_Dca001267 [Dendrobium catenatum]|uniref:Uncharacterized protein n=1 Tax=Dendrobium catenatum TaxID=906689 RepID=A0A2I0WLX0_9ASPA|nr:hypothetical protein MA16_Dca001267 [Dendrobium catenatum]
MHKSKVPFGFRHAFSPRVEGVPKGKGGGRASSSSPLGFKVPTGESRERGWWEKREEVGGGIPKEKKGGGGRRVQGERD